MFQPQGFSSLLKEGSRLYTGVEESIIRNIEAISEVMQMTRTSLGPNGMNKFIINHIDKLILTKDSGIMMKELDVNHPAARLIVHAIKMQCEEQGDATNFVVTLAGELLTLAQSLIKSGLHPADILNGYEKAFRKTLDLLDSLPKKKLENLSSVTEVSRFLTPVIGTKMLHGQESILAPLLAEACIKVLPSDPKNFNTDNVRVCKMLGGSLGDSSVIQGLVVLRLTEGYITKVDACKVAVYNCPLDAHNSETKDTVLFKNSAELMSYNRSEEENMEKIIKSIVDAGVKCVIVGGSVSTTALHYLDHYKIMVFRIMSKFEIRRIAKSIGATMLVRLGAPTPEEMGTVDRIYTDEIGSNKCIIIEKKSDENKLATILLRGSTSNILENIERAIETGVNSFRAICRDPYFVAGAGATEQSIAGQIREYAKTVSGLDQYSITKFGEAFEIVPRTIAENAGLNVNELMANLNTKNSQDPTFGVDVTNGDLKSAFELGVFDHLDTKKWALRFSVEAVLTILRVDQIIVAKPAGGPNLNKKPPVNEADEF